MVLPAPLAGSFYRMAMPAKSISRSAFIRFLPTVNFLESVTGEGVEWFVDDAREFLGIVARNKTGNEWTAVVLERDTEGQFRSIEIADDFRSRRQARQQLLLTVTAAATQRRKEH